MEHGNSERILDALVMVKLLPTLKHVINSKKVSQDYECSLSTHYLKTKTRSSSIFIFFLGAGFQMSFQGIVVHQL